MQRMYGIVANVTEVLLFAAGAAIMIFAALSWS
jgi:hypothetical protein